MAKIEMLMPRMGESIFECTVLSWLKQVGDRIELDEMLVEVATDKIDTEIGSSHEGILKEILIPVGEVATIGKPICIIETEGVSVSEEVIQIAQKLETQVIASTVTVAPVSPTAVTGSRFYSPLVKNIAKTEHITMDELESIAGTGLDGRVTKNDIFAYLDARKNSPNIGGNVSDEIIEMDRMRKIIAERMVDSKRISPHVSSFVETDMSRIVAWRTKNKGIYKETHQQNLTYTPLLIWAVAKAIREFPMINVQVQNDKIIKKGNINIGMAVALPSGNLIVPVIHNADRMSLLELTRKVNDLTQRARENKLKPDDLADGTYTVSNIGTFGNVMGTPIIVQPQVAIMAFGVIQKKPAVIETPEGDFIGIRSKMFISHSYDHRVVDGSLGGMFVKRVSDLLEQFEQPIH